MLLSLACAALLAASVPTVAAGELGLPAQRRELITRTEAKLRKRCRKLVKVQNKLVKAAGNEKKTTKLQGKLEKLRRRGATKKACGLGNRCSDDFLGTLDNEDTFLADTDHYNLEPIGEWGKQLSGTAGDLFNSPGEPVPYGAYLGHGCYPDGGAYYLYNYPGSEFWLAGDYDPPIHYNYRYAAQSYYDCCCDDTPGVCVEGDIGFEETEPSGD